MKTTLLLTGIALLLANVARACESDSTMCCAETKPRSTEPRPNGVNQAQVAILAFLFQPAQITVPIGATVRWTNDDPSDHTVTSSAAQPLFDSGLLGPGAIFNHTFGAPGDYPYICAIHFGMDGSVDVRGPGDANGDNRTDIADFAILSANFNLPDRDYNSGDFDLSQTTDIADFAILAANFNVEFFAPLGSAIPEPSCGLWFLAGTSLLFRYRRKKRGRCNGIIGGATPTMG